MKKNMSLQALILICMLNLILGCGGEREPPDQFEKYVYSTPVFKQDGWEVGHLDDVKINLSLLTEMMNRVNDNTFINIDSIQIVRDNKLIFDELIRTQLSSHDIFIGNTDLSVHSMQSTTKSFASAFVGIAIDKEIISDVKVPFYDFFEEYSSFDNWSNDKAIMTLQNVLTMRHGWAWDEWSTPYSNSSNTLGSTYRNSQDHVKYLLDLAMQTMPGSTYAYSTIASVALGAAVENASGLQLEDFANTYFFQPLGIESHIWAYTPVGRAHTGGGLWLGGRDMLKFGQLYLNDGLWNGEQIISAQWIKESLSKRVSFDYGHSDGYGYQWWHKGVSNAGQELLDVWFTAGNGGQFIYIIPSKNTVIAFTGGNYDDPLMYQADTIMINYVLPALL